MTSRNDRTSALPPRPLIFHDYAGASFFGFIRTFLLAATAAAAPTRAFGEDDAKPQRPAIPGASREGALFDVGVAALDITPDYPVRLGGFPERRAASRGVAQRIRAKALAVGSGGHPPVVILTLDCGRIPGYMTHDVAARLERKKGLPRENLVVCSSHSHAAPYIESMCPLLFTPALTGEERGALSRYERELTGRLEEVGLAALDRRRPGRLHWAEGAADFARNRRDPDGPVDHTLPVLRVSEPDGSIRAILASYACHANTYSGNEICGDWVGFAQESVERRHPGAACLMAVGCAGDQVPGDGSGLEAARLQGETIGLEIDRLLRGPMRAIGGHPFGRLRWIILPFAELPTPAEMARRASRGGSFGNFWREQLEKRKQGRLRLPQALSFPVQSIAFGSDLAVVFLGGEAVADYALRLREELDGSRLWIVSYANEVRAHIPSRRIIQEGGFEGDGDIVRSGLPGRFVPEIEDRIVEAVKEVVAAGYRIPPPASGHDSVDRMHLAEGFEVELAAAEPLTMDPVAIAWGTDGKLWVVEMADYPLGMDGKMQPGGRVRCLEDTNGDGRYDASTVFLDGLNMPNGILPWRGGVLVTAAPEIFFARDADGDGRADERRALFRGLEEGNPQLRVNGLRPGLDNWVYCANGFSGGVIHSLETGARVNIRGRDVRIRPDTGGVDALSGMSQFGRNRDDWGNWFGCNNSFPLWHYVLEDRYTRRNPHAASRDPRRLLLAPSNPRVFPVRPPQKRFHSVEQAGRFTSACSAMIYRDELLFGRGEEMHAFVCEPVHNLVRHEILEEDGASFRALRLSEQREEEFLASEDLWFRPVMVRTGPDGALWVVDMCRYVIEHPEFLPPAGREALAPHYRAGEDRGRIYRVFPTERRPRQVPRLDGLPPRRLAAALDSPSGWQRDAAQQLLVSGRDPRAVPPLRALLGSSDNPLGRLHALSTLDGVDALEAELVEKALRDAHPGVRRHALRIAESRAGREPRLLDALLELVADDDRKVLLQLACTLGEIDDPRAGRALGRLLLERPQELYLRAAVFSSVSKKSIGEVLSGALMALESRTVGSALTSTIERLLGMAGDFGRDDVLLQALERVIAPGAEPRAPWRMEAVARLLEALDRRGVELAQLAPRRDDAGGALLERLGALMNQARAIAAERGAAEAARVAAVRLLGYDPSRREEDLKALGELLVPQTPPAVQAAAVARLGRARENDVPNLLLAGWRGHSPALRSRILSVLSSRGEWLRVLLDRVESEDVLPTELDAVARQRLAAHRNADIRKRVEKIFALTASSDREEAVRTYRSALRMPGDPERGAAVFEERCSPCHRIDDVGYEVGPNLLSLTDRSPGSLLVSILDPSRSVNPSFAGYAALTTDGRILTGLLASETGNSISLLGQEGELQVILRKDLASLESTGKSMMPDGLEADMTRQQVADVIAFLRR